MPNAAKTHSTQLEIGNPSERPKYLNTHRTLTITQSRRCRWSLFAFVSRFGKGQWLVGRNNGAWTAVTEHIRPHTNRIRASRRRGVIESTPASGKRKTYSQTLRNISHIPVAPSSRWCMVPVGNMIRSVYERWNSSRNYVAHFIHM